MKLRSYLWITIICLVASLSLCACGESTNSDSEEEPTTVEQKYDVSIEVECIENLFFSKYDVDVYLDDQILGTLDHGDTESFTCELIEGTHEIAFQEEDDSEVDGVETINVTKEGKNDFAFRITCSSSQIDVEVVDKEKEASEAASEEASEESEAAVEEETTTSTKETKKKSSDKKIKKLESFTGEKCFDVIDDIKDMGYTPIFLAANTKDDMTSSIEYEMEEGYTESNWIIASMSDVDTDDKTVEYIVTSQWMRDNLY